MSINWVKFRRECIEFMAVEHDFKLEEIAHYHFRLTNKQDKRLDYFPKSRKATWVSTNRWFVIDDIEKFILNTFLNYGKVHNKPGRTYYR